MSDYTDYMELKTLFSSWMKQGVPMSPEIKRLYWSELKRLERSTRCRTGDGARCMGNCSSCPNQRTGVPLSLDVCLEDGLMPADPFSVEEYLENAELSEAVSIAIASLDKTDRHIIIRIFMEGATERELAPEVGMSQKGINGRKHKILSILRNILKDYR